MVKFCTYISLHIFLLGLLNTAAMGRSSRLLIKDITKASRGYKACIKQAKIEIIRLRKVGKYKPAKKRESISACQEMYPAAVDYRGCKKKASKLIKTKSPKAAKAALRQCRKNLKKETFNIGRLTPFDASAAKGRITFAGIGLQKRIPINALPPPGFECNHLNEVIASKNGAIYALFGNDLQQFTKARLNRIRKNYGPFTKKGSHSYLDRYKVMYEAEGSKVSTYFPLGSCSYNRNLGKRYEALKVYYLLDLRKSIAIPYFAVAFYNEKTKGKSPLVIESLLKELGKDYSASDGIRGSNTWIHENKLQGLNSEKGPFNICKPLESHKYVGMTHKARKNSEKLDYLLLANIRNLCDYGVRHFSRIGN